LVKEETKNKQNVMFKRVQKVISADRRPVESIGSNKRIFERLKK